jgi:O-antigen/teichoic acid export membrane protein
VNLLKTSLYTSIATGISFITGFIVTKVVAVQIGPSGIAYLGQFQNSVSILTVFATGAIATGVVKYLAQDKDDNEKRQQLINTATILVFGCSFFVSLIIIFASNYLSLVAFKNTDFRIVYLLFGIFMMTFSFNVIFGAILNGLKEIRRFTIVNISSSLIGLAITVSFAYYFGVKGVLLSGTALSVIIFFINLYIFNKAGIKWKPDFNKWDTAIFKKLFGFTLMAIVSGLLVPSIQILVRDKIIRLYNLEEAGYWQAVTKISDYYLAFITLTLGVYYMPKLSEITKAYKIVLPLVASFAFLIWLLRDIIIQVLFTKSFQPMNVLFTYQLLGDVFKIGSWLLANIMIAKAMIRTYIVTEFIFATTYVLLCFVFIDHFGIIGATYGFCVNYGLYWIVMAFIMKNKI